MPQNVIACKSAFAPAYTSEVCRKAARGRSRRFGGLRQTILASARGPHSRSYRPRAPRTRLPPDDSYLADLGRACAGGSRAAKSYEESLRVPL